MGAVKPLELSVEELWNKAEVRQVIGEVGNSDGVLNLVGEHSKFHYLPSSVVSTAKDCLGRSGDVEDALRYIYYAFSIYRASTVGSWAAPHYKANGCYEWPEPVKFSWSDIGAVIVGGEYINGPILNKKKPVETESRCGKKKSVAGIVSLNSDFKKSVDVRDVIPGKDNLSGLLKYRIRNLHNVGLIGSQSWQNTSLRNYINPICTIIEDYSSDRLSKEDAKKRLDFILRELSKSYDVPVARYVRMFEKPKFDPDVFFF